MTLTEFLLARYAEVEAAMVSAARIPVQPVDWPPGDGLPVIGYAAMDDGCSGEVFHMCVDPQLVQADLEAKRRIVEMEFFPEAHEDDYGIGQVDTHGDILRLLALSYAAHPDYREEWRS